MTIHKSPAILAARTVPRVAHIYARCSAPLCRDIVRSIDARSLTDKSAVQFLSAIFEHVAESNHSVSVTVTESFQVVPLDSGK